jgi:predicted adenine nucleotide alpha hydrolase (AANH) superfamily ATPase
MKLLLHTCCGPCSIYPTRVLLEKKYDIMGYFFRSNIHPYTECLKRQETLSVYVQNIGIKLVIQEDYDLEGFLQNMVFREKDRCRFCYHTRLQAAAIVAKRGKFDLFSTTLLYSKFQNHETIRDIGEAVGETVGVPFYYQDFREGWQEGIEASKRLGMYRQSYCGCIYSEKERYCHS